MWTQLPHVHDLIRGVTPTLSGWTVNPTNAANITDGDPTTTCNTGNKVMGTAWLYGYFEWDFGEFHDVFISGVGTSGASAGTPEVFVHTWNGTAWVAGLESIGYGTSVRMYKMFGARCSKVRIGVTSSAASTITPHIREFHAWRLL